MDRSEGRKPDELREWRIIRGVLDHAEGSALVEAGRTRVRRPLRRITRLPARHRRRHLGALVKSVMWIVDTGANEDGQR